MKEFVGIKPCYDPFIDVFARKASIYSILKREALIFNRIAFPVFNDLLSYCKMYEMTRGLVDVLEMLYQNGLIIEAEILSESQDQRLKLNAEFRDVSEVKDHLRGISLERIKGFTGFDLTKIKEIDESFITELMNKLRSLPEEQSDELLKTAFPLMLHYDQYLARSVSIQLREVNQMDTCPILSLSIPPVNPAHVNKTDVVQIVLNALLVPDDSTPWEQIFEYRSDPDSRHRFLDLRNWMSEVARDELTPLEVEQKLEHLMSKYQRHIEVHKMKTQPGTFKAYIIAGARTAENFIKGNWGKMAEQLLIKQSKITLVEGELNSPGSEVAYIVKAKETFS